MKKRLLAITLVIASVMLAGCQLDTSQLASSVTIPVPNVIGMSLEDATTELTSQGLTIGDTRYEDSDKAKDTVILSDPLPGTSVEGSSKINLILSSGSQKERALVVKVPVPDSSDAIEFTVYIDGEQDSSYTKTVDPTATSIVTYKFKGTTGKTKVAIKSNDQPYKSYTLDFDKGRVTEDSES